MIIAIGVGIGHLGFEGNTTQRTLFDDLVGNFDDLVGNFDDL
jgi:hypothetical protein